MQASGGSKPANLQPSPAPTFPSLLQEALRHEAHAAYEAKRYALLQKQHEEASGRATGEAQERAATSSAALAEQRSLERSLRAEARAAAVELNQLRVRGG